MKILKKIAFNIVKYNKEKALATFIGIFLSALLLSIIGNIMIITFNSLLNREINEGGYYHIRLQNINNDILKEIENDNDYAIVSKLFNVGFDIIDKNDGTKELIHVYSINYEDFKNINYSIIKGNYPKLSTEILVSKEYATLNNLEIGDSIIYNLGELVDGEYSKDSYSLSNESKIEKPITSKYTIVGLYNGNYINQITNAKTSNEFDVYIAFKDPIKFNSNIKKITTIIANDAKIKYSINDSLLKWQVFAFKDDYKKLINTIFLITTSIIIITSIISTSNTLEIFVSESKKNLAKLNSIGATRKQLKQIVKYEVIYLGLIGILSGVISGYVLSYFLTYIFNNVSFIHNIIYLQYKVSLIPAVISIIGGLIILFFDYKKITIIKKDVVINKIKNYESVKINKETFIIKKIYTIFKTGGVISYKYLKRNKKKYNKIISSISFCISLFIISYIVGYYVINNVKEEYKYIDYNVSVTFSMSTPDSIKKLFYSLDEPIISYVIDPNTPGVYVNSDTSHINNKVSKVDMFCNKGDCKNKIPAIQMPIIIIDDVSFKKFSKNLKLKYEIIKDKAIIVNDGIIKTNNKKKKVKYTNYNVNDTITFINTKYNKSFKTIVGGFSEKLPWGYDVHKDTAIIILNKKYLVIEDELINMVIFYNSSNPDKLYNEINKIKDDSVYVFNLSEEVNKSKYNVFLFLGITNLIVFLIYLINASSIINVININAKIRRRDFAILKSIGMTKKEFNNMFIFESAFYTFKGLLYGVIFGLVGSYAVYEFMKNYIDFGFIFPIIIICVMTLFVFIISYITVKRVEKKYTNNNIITTINNENI